ncbi:RagB/SusD family nutrient uptake outer membrane protein [Aestuariivivens insulae]|uniref:RagB/SusD family nutrient uptake outer membrane protein n=1 Tax=Aestuariivivens insulae TaxID=1621988 RepID=UPI001F5AE70B|nr:RagB/SusD family nutrient uptake outer membrane protein [Aestuariivivens insulae]
MKIKLITIAILSALIFSGCDKNLDVLPTDNISSENLYLSEAGIEAGLAGIYSRILFAYRGADFAFSYPSSFTDEAHYCRKGLTSFIKNNFTPSTPQLAEPWTELYSGINAANIYLEKVAAAGFLSEEDRLEYLADGYFIRAYMYLDLERAFGGIEGIPMPLVENRGELLPRTPGIDVYKQIIKDFEFAAENLPDDADAVKGRPGKNAAKGLIARAYMYLAGEPFNEPGAYEKMRDWSKAVIDDGYNELNPSYKDIFIRLAQEEFERKEVLFQFAFSYENQNNQRASKLGSAMGYLCEDEACYKSYESHYATVSLVLQYRSDPDDERGLWNTDPTYIRRTYNCRPIGKVSQFRYCPSKYRRQYEEDPSNTSWGAHHWPILRYSDILLMYAEAENQLNPGSTIALDAVNQVRNRAKATPLAGPITEDLIQEERRLELCFEGLRKYDLVRWGNLEEKVNETKALMEELVADPNFYNDDWLIYGEPNMGPDGLPQTGDEPAVLETRRNVLHTSFEHFEGYNDFDITKHYILPIPEQEVGVNPYLRQTQGW